MSYYRVVEYDNLLQVGIILGIALYVAYQIFFRKEQIKENRIKRENKLQKLQQKKKEIENKYKDIDIKDPKYINYLKESNEIEQQINEKVPKVIYKYIIGFGLSTIIFIFSNEILDFLT